MATASTAALAAARRTSVAFLAWMAAAAMAAAAVLGSLAEGFHVSVSWLDFSYTRDESSRLNSRTAACRVCFGESGNTVYVFGIFGSTLKKSQIYNNNRLVFSLRKNTYL